MKALALACLGILLAGCGGPGPQMHTCPDGTQVDLRAHPAYGNATFVPGQACPKPAPPAVVLDGEAFTVGLYKSLAFSWSLVPGNHTGGHSMLSSIRLSHHRINVTELDGPESYGRELVRAEHQNLPANLNVTTPAGTFTAAGTFFVRAYATIYADGLPAADYWSDEAPITIEPVQPTGRSETVRHTAGDFLGGLDRSDVALVIGDQLVFANDDVVEHTLTLTSGPPGVTFDPLVAPSMGAAPPLLLRVPGSYTFTSDDVQPETLRVSVAIE